METDFKNPLNILYYFKFNFLSFRLIRLNLQKTKESLNLKLKTIIIKHKSDDKINEKNNKLYNIEVKSIETICTNGKNFCLKYKNVIHLKTSKCNPKV